MSGGRRPGFENEMLEAPDGTYNSMVSAHVVRVVELRPSVVVRIGEEVLRRYECPEDHQDRAAAVERARRLNERLRAAVRAVLEEDVASEDPCRFSVD